MQVFYWCKKSARDVISVRFLNNLIQSNFADYILPEHAELHAFVAGAFGQALEQILQQGHLQFSWQVQVPEMAHLHFSAHSLGQSAQQFFLQAEAGQQTVFWQAFRHVPPALAFSWQPTRKTVVSISAVVITIDNKSICEGFLFIIFSLKKLILPHSQTIAF